MAYISANLAISKQVIDSLKSRKSLVQPEATGTVIFL